MIQIGIYKQGSEVRTGWVEPYQGDIDEIMEEHNGDRIKLIGNDFGIDIPNTASLDLIAELQEGVERHGEAFALYAEHEGLEFTDRFEEAYQGCWGSELEYAREFHDSCCGAEGQQYFDYEAFARDLFMDHYSVEGEEGYHVFRSL